MNGRYIAVCWPGTDVADVWHGMDMAFMGVLYDRELAKSPALAVIMREGFYGSYNANWRLSKSNHHSITNV